VQVENCFVFFRTLRDGPGGVKFFKRLVHIRDAAGQRRGAEHAQRIL